MAFGHVTEVLTTIFSFRFWLTLISSIFLLINLMNSLTSSSRSGPLILMYFIEGESLVTSLTFGSKFLKQSYRMLAQREDSSPLVNLSVSLFASLFNDESMLLSVAFFLSSSLLDLSLKSFFYDQNNFW